MKEYIIKEDLLKALLTYLASRPYSEVFQAMQVLSTLQEKEQE